MRKIAFLTGLLAGFLLLTAGCGAQVAQKNVEIDYVWTAPATGCSSGCTYVISVLTVANGTASCPAATGTNYTPVNQSAPVSQTSYAYLAPTLGTSQCAIVQAYNGIYSSASAPSNVVAVPLQPGLPGAPAGNEKTSDLVRPAFPPTEKGRKEMAMNGVARWK